MDGFSICDGDCDDNNALVSAGDLDGDGYSACDTGVNFDCDDNDPQTHPGAAENESNVSACRTDADQDGWGSRSPRAGVESGNDCNDSDDSENGTMQTTMDTAPAMMTVTT